MGGTDPNYKNRLWQPPVHTITLADCFTTVKWATLRQSLRHRYSDHKLEVESGTCKEQCMQPEKEAMCKPCARKESVKRRDGFYSTLQNSRESKKEKRFFHEKAKKRNCITLEERRKIAGQQTDAYQLSNELGTDSNDKWPRRYNSRLWSHSLERCSMYLAQSIQSLIISV